MTRTPAETLRTLVGHPHCVDAVVDSLQSRAAEHPDAGIFNDLSAAYYVRAQENDEPVDLLRSLDAALQALDRASRMPEALFNRALAEEALGFEADAVAAWDAFQRADHSQWSVEATEHRVRLTQAMAVTAESQWDLKRQRIVEAATAGDVSTLSVLVESYPAQRYVEGEVLPQWAAAVARRDRTTAAKQWNVADAVARELARRGDRYLLDDLDLIRKSPRRLELRNGHIALGRARVAEKAFKSSEEFYREAERLLSETGSPLRAAASLGVAQAIVFKPRGPWRVMPRLERAERIARRRGYSGLQARIKAFRAFALIYQSRYVESLAEYDASSDISRLSVDAEGAARARARAIGDLRVLGKSHTAWRRAYEIRRYMKRFSDAQDRHFLLGETAETALGLGYARVALLYQNAAVQQLQDELAVTRDPDRVRRLRHNLGIAVRERAGIHATIDHFDEAQRDIALAEKLAEVPYESIRRKILARIQEVEGRAIAHSDPRRAVEAFSKALLLAPPNEFRTFRAVLYAQRAAAYDRLRRKEEAERDLRAALSELRAEETEILAHRVRGRDEQLWSPYFARFQETYGRLISLLAEQHRPEEAFGYAEKARAFEPLNLVLQLGALPAAFRKLAEHDTMRLSRIQEKLPRATFLVEYCVLDDQTYAWIVSRDGFDMLTLPVKRKSLENWTAELQRDARQRNEAAFEAGLSAPYDALIAPALEAIGKMPAGDDPARRVVFVPDHTVQGLPLAALWDRRNRRYLVQEITLSVAGSATLYVFSLLHDRALPKTEPPSVLLIADPAFNQHLELTDGFERLPRARSEVARIHELYGPSATELVDAQATFPAFLNGARSSTVVHLAGHAVANPEAPHRSLLLLAPSIDHPGTVSAEELLTRPQLRRTRLFVLSACSSAGGLPVGPEGLGPLVRPLIATGVPGVVGTLWNVSDSLFEELLVDFHRHYRDGDDAAAALQRAQLDQLDKKSRGLRSVLAWAPFQVIGYASSPFPHDKRRDLQ
ncbi:MAG TPA: CHAT domain-containing protein [Thermoanaerobaculia bacterium]|jgi:CHAT domain-containing protein